MFNLKHLGCLIQELKFQLIEDAIEQTFSYKYTWLLTTLFYILAITVAAAYSGYSGSLALNDTTFIRPNGDWALYYYKAIQVSVFASGSYTLSGSSIIGINGILYNNSFNRANPTRNIISSDDNPNGNNQFTITTWLRPADTYILVVTSYRSYEQGSFVIAADGPARPSFNLLTATRGK